MKLLIFPADSSGCGSYRMIIPANIIAKNNLADVKVSFTVNDELMQWADLIIWQRQYKPNLLDFAKKYKALGKKQVFEIDDDLWSLTPANPAYVHYPHAILKQLNEFINTCDAITCSAEPLKQELVRKFKKPTYVLHNSILSNYIIPPNKIENEIRIGWVGSAHHHDDLKYAIHAIKDVHNKYKNTKLVFMGGTVDKYLDMFDRSRLEFHNWVDFKDYYDKLNSLNLHIGLAPIEDNKFNSSKSSLRFLEYSLCGAATIASDVYPYTNAIENGKDGIIVKKNKHLEWVKSLSNLIENPDKITELCSASQIKIKEKYDYYKNIGSWINIYNEVLGDTKRVIINSEVTAEYTKPKSAYELWFEKNEPTSIEIDQQRTTKFEYEPKLSLITPAFNPDKKYLIGMIDSVISQTYSNWELCLADASTDIEITKIVENYAVKDSRIKVHFLNNKGISENSNEALLMATGEFIGLLDHDDTLAPFALHEIVKTINENKDVEFIYSDEDKLDEVGSRTQPHFKPDLSPELMLGYNYICHLSVFKKSLLDKIGNFNKEFDGAQDYDLILRATESTKNIVHIPKILYHWQMSTTSTSSNLNNKTNILDVSKKLLSNHLERTSTIGTVEDGLFYGSYRLKNIDSNRPKVSILIPNHNQLDLLKKCINSILIKTAYNNYEILILENNSTDKKLFTYYEELSKMVNIKIIEWNNKFNFSSINNYGASLATGEYLLFLNNDIEVISESWIDDMVVCMRDGVGVVGAKLYYPDNTIQHAGVVLSQGGPGHVYCKRFRDHLGYMGRLKIIQNFMAVTGACLLTSKKIFDSLTGFDENLVLAFNDIDYCYRVCNKGYRIVWTPYAELYHHESLTRGYENTPEKIERFNKEFNYLKDRWGGLIRQGDKMFPMQILTCGGA